MWAEALWVGVVKEEVIMVRVEIVEVELVVTVEVEAKGGRN